MRTQRKVVNSLALTVALGASATNLQVKADEVVLQWLTLLKQS
ncbi:hypothetical protein ACS60J_01045 [Streptococcus suis]